MAKVFRCNACKSNFPNRRALKQHNKMKHRVRGAVTKLSYSLAAAGLIALLWYSGVFGSLGQSISPSSHQPVIMHIHPSVEIRISNKQIPIPANMGIDSRLWRDRSLEGYGMPMPNMREMPYMSPLHTHDTSGTIHVESTVNRNYTLGEFFDIWGVPFSESCILDKCGGAGSIMMYVNGVLSSEFRNHILKDGERIRIEFNGG